MKREPILKKEWKKYGFDSGYKIQFIDTNNDYSFLEHMWENFDDKVLIFVYSRKILRHWWNYSLNLLPFPDLPN